MILTAMMTTAGLTALANQVVGLGSIAPWTYIALDASNTALSAAHTGPQSEITTNGGARAAATATIETCKSVISHTFPITGPLTVWGACMMNAATGGTMLMRDLRSAALTPGNTDNLTVVLKMDNQAPA